MSLESFFTLLALLIFAGLTLGPIGFFLVLALQSRLRRAELRIEELEQQMKLQASREMATRPVQTLQEPTASQEPTQAEAPPSTPVIVEPVAPPLLEPAVVPAPPPAIVPKSVPQVVLQDEADTAVEPPGPPPPLATPAPSLEESLGTRWAVWIGGVALGLGGLLLVRYSIEQGWFGPAARTLAGFLFAATLVVAGEIMRRRPQMQAPATASAQIPAVLTAAGTLTAFGTVYAAHALYHFIGPGAAFLALGCLGLITMAAAALHGPALAGLGLLGALAAPLLVEAKAPDPWPVVIYIGFVTASAYGLARLKYWLWLALSGAAGGFLWGVALLDSQAEFRRVGALRIPATQTSGLHVFGADAVSAQAASFAPLLFHALIQTLLALAVFVFVRRPAERIPANDFNGVGVAVPSLFTFLMAATLSHAFAAYAGLGFPTLALPLAAAFAVAASGLAFAEAAALTLTSGALLVVMLIIWPNVPAEGLTVSAAQDFWPALRRPQGFFAPFALLTLPALASAAGLRLIRSPELRTRPAALYGATACLVPLAGLIIAYLRLKSASDGMVFAALAAGLAFCFVFAASVLLNRLQTRDAPAFRLALGAYAAAALAALSFGLVFALDRGMLTVAFALSALGASFVDRRLDIPALRWGVAVLGAIIAARLAIDPRVVGADLGTTPIFNWLLWGYGVPAFSFAVAAELMRRRGEDLPVQIAQGLAILFSAFLIFFEIRHAIHGGDPFAAGSDLAEQGLFATASFSYAILVTRLDALRSNVVLRAASLGFGLISFAVTAFGLLIFANPLFGEMPLEGGTLFNTLVLAYLLPAVLAYILIRIAKGVRPGWYVIGAKTCLHVLIFAFFNLELRRLFQGPELWLFGTYLKLRLGDAELYAYSALWLGLGIAYLGYGLLRHSAQARLISGLLVAASIVKVFLIDLASLEGILRALSFIGLGLVLIAVGFVYQRFVFARRPPQA